MSLSAIGLVDVFGEVDGTLQPSCLVDVFFCFVVFFLRCGKINICEKILNNNQKQKRTRVKALREFKHNKV